MSERKLVEPEPEPRREESDDMSSSVGASEEVAADFDGGQGGLQAMRKRGEVTKSVGAGEG